MTASPAPPPGWRHETAGESRIWVSVGLVVVGLLHLVLPSDLAVLHAPEVTGAVIVVLGVAVWVANPQRLDHRSRMLRVALQATVGVIAVVNAISLGLLISAIVGRHALPPEDLLLGGLVVWLTNVAAFGFWYWEYDRGGPADRANAVAEVPDLQFPQMTDDRLAATFDPTYIDYLYVSLTNALAFSPTDTMPLSRWCKVLFAAESLVSFVTIALVAARAINVLPQ